MLRKVVKWWNTHVCFISIHKNFSAVYIYWHLFPKYCIRLYTWGIDWHIKPTITYDEGSVFQDKLDMYRNEI